MSIKHEIQKISPLQRDNGNNEVQIISAKTNMLAQKIVYFGGIGILVATSIACLYIFTFKPYSKSFDDAVRLIFIIVGAISSHLYSSIDKAKNKD